MPWEVNAYGGVARKPWPAARATPRQRPRGLETGGW
jgi:hypothetical protein